MTKSPQAISGQPVSELNCTRDPTRQAIVISSDDPDLLQKAETLLELFKDRLFDNSPERMNELVDRMMPLVDPPTSTDLFHARANVEARAAVIEEFGLLSSHDIHDLTGAKASNKAARAARLKKVGKLFAVPFEGRMMYPGFQLDRSGQPRAVMAQVLKVLSGWAGWQIAIWFITENAWLDDQRPVDLLDRAPQAIVEAARKEVDIAF